MILSMARREVITARPDDSVRDVANLMQYYNVGCVVVVQDDRPVGIVTDRDLALRVLAETADEKIPQLLISEVMTRPPQAILEEESVSKAVELMRNAGARRLPVVDRRGRLRGLVTLDDLIEAAGSQLSEIAGLIRRQQKAPKRALPKPPPPKPMEIAIRS